VSDPLDFIGTAELGIACGIALVGVYTTGRLIKAIGPSDPAVKPLKLELPVTSATAKRLVEDWEKRDALGAVKRFVYADFLFLLCYGVAIAALGSLAGRAADDATLGAVFTYAGLAAAVLDILENAGMLRMMGKHFEQPLPVATTIVSAIKWVLAAVGVIGSLAVLIFT
jgi:hypothetical protein